MQCLVYRFIMSYHQQKLCTILADFWTCKGVIQCTNFAFLLHITLQPNRDSLIYSQQARRQPLRQFNCRSHQPLLLCLLTVPKNKVTCSPQKETNNKKRLLVFASQSPSRYRSRWFDLSLFSATTSTDWSLLLFAKLLGACC